MCVFVYVFVYFPVCVCSVASLLYVCVLVSVCVPLSAQKTVFPSLKCQTVSTVISRVSVWLMLKPSGNLSASADGQRLQSVPCITQRNRLPHPANKRADSELAEA